MKRTKPPFRADHVGSLLRPKALHDARAKRAKGEITAEQLKEIEDREIERVIKKQEEVGLQSVTDGEFRRSWWHLDFLWGLDGAEKHIMDAGVQFSGMKTRNEGVKVTGKLDMKAPHPMVEHFKFLAAHTKAMPKITIPAPSAIYGRPTAVPIDKSVYPAMDQFWDDLGQAYRKAVRGFADAGCRYLQLDEVFIAMLCDAKYRKQMVDRGDDPEKLGCRTPRSGCAPSCRGCGRTCRSSFRGACPRRRCRQRQGWPRLGPGRWRLQQGQGRAQPQPPARQPRSVRWRWSWLGRRPWRSGGPEGSCPGPELPPAQPETPIGPGNWTKRPAPKPWRHWSAGKTAQFASIAPHSSLPRKSPIRLNGRTKPNCW